MRISGSSAKILVPSLFYSQTLTVQNTKKTWRSAKLADTLIRPA